MKFTILNEQGDETILVPQGKVKEAFKKQVEQGRYAVDPKNGEKYESPEKIPDTVDELLWGKLEHRGEHGN